MKVAICCVSFRISVEHRRITVDNRFTPSKVVVRGYDGTLPLTDIKYCPFCGRRIWRFAKPVNNRGTIPRLVTELFDCFDAEKEES